MAKLRLGVIAGQASGSLGSTVFSHNRGGPYARLRAVPVKVTSAWALDTKAYLSEQSQQWAALTQDQREAWNNWADNNPITDKLGDKRLMTGHQAFIKLTTRQRRSGSATLTDPPTGARPAAVSEFSIAGDATAGTVTATYSNLPANMKPWLYMCQVDSQGIVYVENLLRLCSIGAADEASPWDVTDDFTARFGTIIADNVIHAALFVYDSDTGLLSARLTDSAVIT